MSKIFTLSESPRFSAPLWILALVGLLSVVFNQGAKAQDYLLSPDDTIGVVVLRHPELSVPLQVVPSSGKIQVPGVGDVFVAGKTTSRVATEITTRLKRVLLRPEVVVSLVAQRVRRIFVSGAVLKTGSLEVKPGFRISESIALAGGLLAPPERVSGTLSRAGMKPLKLDLVTILRDSASPKNYVLRNGDVLRFSERIYRVNIVGQVAKTGPVDVPIGSNVVQALAIAGGPSAKAALSRVTVRRANGKEYPVDLYRAIVRGEGSDNFRLAMGDTITVPEAMDRVTVLGAAMKAGFYDIPDGNTLTVSQALSLAGGVAPRAALTRARLRRANGQEEPLDLYKISVLGLQDGNVVLKPGDAIIIPESKGVSVLGAVTRPGVVYLEEAKMPRVADVLGQAGGLSIAPESAIISISRQSGMKKPLTLSIDPVALLQRNSWSQNSLVQDGDVIVVSSTKMQTVFVSGYVRTPGAFELREQDGLTALLTRAGGPLPTASLRRVTITRRDGTVQMIDAFDAVRTGTPIPFELQEGDYVVVPENTNRVLIMAAVANPGTYTIPEDRPLTVNEALVLAGGPVNRAKLKEIAILHQTPEGVQRRVLSLNNVRDVQMNSQVTLRNGDILYVPMGSQTKSGWDIISRGVGLLGVFGGL